VFASEKSSFAQYLEDEIAEENCAREGSSASPEPPDSVDMALKAVGQHPFRNANAGFRVSRRCRPTTSHHCEEEGQTSAASLPHLWPMYSLRVENPRRCARLEYCVPFPAIRGSCQANRTKGNVPPRPAGVFVRPPPCGALFFPSIFFYILGSLFSVSFRHVFQMISSTFTP
jgi:hypothetical protein